MDRHGLRAEQELELCLFVLITAKTSCLRRRGHGVRYRAGFMREEGVFGRSFFDGGVGRTLDEVVLVRHPHPSTNLVDG